MSHLRPTSGDVAAGWLRRMVKVEAGEVPGLSWAFLYHFCLLCSYYILRPIRDEMGIAGGVENLQWLFLATFLAMVAIVPMFGWLTSHVPRRRFLPYAYLFFVANIALFFMLFRSGIAHVHLARVFFVWVSVFNLFIVSVFWSFMTDIFNDTQSKRLFGFIAAGGTAGAITGPAIAGGLTNVVGVTNLLLISAGFLLIVLLCIQRLAAWAGATAMASQAPGQLSTNESSLKPARTRQAGGAEETRHTHVAKAKSATDGSQEATLGGGVWAALKLVARSDYLLVLAVLQNGG